MGGQTHGAKDLQWYLLQFQDEVGFFSCPLILSGLNLMMTSIGLLFAKFIRPHFVLAYDLQVDLPLPT